jgi:hypothetical protein
VKEPPKPLSLTPLRALVLFAVAEGYYRESFHAAEDHPERNISLDDVLAGLERDDWTLEGTKYDSEHKNWKYTIKTKDIEDYDLHIVVTADQKRTRIKVITRW